MAVLKENLYLHSEISGKRKHAIPCKATWRNTRSAGGRREEGESKAQNLYWGFQGEEWVRQGNYAE